MLQLDNPKAAIADTTAVIEAIQGKAAPGDKQLKDLLYKAIFRWFSIRVHCCCDQRRRAP